ncbi:MAG: proton-conducting transporter membrane subunit [Candidatus Dormibacteria bacterium]|jgi:NADH:ubiquinone oxidoreductase subunit 5 (subunit L)/multisubunit Na+/H+ antiporter MnhA subunit
MYLAFWAVLLLPILGAAFSFVAETPRRAAHVTLTFLGAALLLGLIVLGYRIAHFTSSAKPFISVLTFVSVRPDTSELTFPTDFHPQFGLVMDNLSTAFVVLTTFLFIAVQGLGTAMLKGDAGYRRFFWVTSLLAAAMIAVIDSPSLFQTWLAMGVVSALTLVLALHWWHRDGSGPPARRAFVTLLGADITLLVGLVLTIAKLGAYLGFEPLIPNQTYNDPFDFTLLGNAWTAGAQGAIVNVGARTLIILAVLVIVPALVHSAQAPFTRWLTGLREAPLPVLAALSLTLLSGLFLLARAYTLLLVSPQVLTVLAVVGAASAVGLGAACLVSTDIYRIALLAAAAQVSLAVAALGAGGYSDAMLIAFVSLPLSLLLLVAAGSLARSYRTRDIHQMGGAWSRMRRTSLALGMWALGAGGLDLVGYDLLSTLFHNNFAGGGRMPTGARDAAVILAVVALALTALSAARLLLTVCRGEPVRRRGFEVDRITEAAPRLRLLQAGLAAATIVAVLAGIPGLHSFGSARGRGHIPGLTFSHWVFYGGTRQVLPVSGAAFLVAAVILVAALVAGVLVWRRKGSDLGARAWSAVRSPLAPALGLALSFGLRVAAGVADGITALDAGLVGPFYDAPAEGIADAVLPLGSIRQRRLRLGLAAVLVVVLILVGASVLAATGHLPVHTT